MAQSGVRTAVLATLLCVGGSLHVGQERNFLYPQGIDNDMHMNVPATVMPVRVGADKGLVSGEVFPAKFRPTPAPGRVSSRCLCRPAGQS